MVLTISFQFGHIKNRLVRVVMYYFLKSIYKSIKRHYIVARLRSRFGSNIESTVDFRFNKLSDLCIGPHVYFGSFTVVHVVNEGSNRNSFLKIGEYTSIGEFNNIRASGGSISIGKKCLISQHVSIIAANHQLLANIPVMDQPWDQSKTGVVIGEDVWIGCNAIILPGVKIGNGAVIGAGSVVTREIPDNAIAFGAPCRVVKYRS
jgi:acetyltransferase-like isoleucine patch superfamily enzyme